MNCQRQKFDILIDRRTPYGNPYPMNGNYGTREEVIERFDRGLNESVLRMLMLDVLKLNKNTVCLGCHCAPLACHGDVYKRRLEELLK